MWICMFPDIFEPRSCIQEAYSIAQHKERKCQHTRSCVRGEQDNEDGGEGESQLRTYFAVM